MIKDHGTELSGAWAASDAAQASVVCASWFFRFLYLFFLKFPYTK